MGTMVHDFALKHEIAITHSHYGCPKEFKGGWDATIGNLNNVLSEAAETRRFEDIEEIVELWKQWGEAQESIHPPGDGGWQYRVNTFMPEDKALSKYKIIMKY